MCSIDIDPRDHIPRVRHISPQYCLALRHELEKHSHSSSPSQSQYLQRRGRNIDHLQSRHFCQDCRATSCRRTPTSLRSWMQWLLRSVAGLTTGRTDCYVACAMLRGSSQAGRGCHARRPVYSLRSRRFPSLHLIKTAALGRHGNAMVRIRIQRRFLSHVP